MENGQNYRIAFSEFILPKFEDHMTFDDDTCILTVHGVSMNDSGVYWCNSGFNESQVYLTVLGKFQQH